MHVGKRPLRVEFLLKTDSGYPKDTGVNILKPGVLMGVGQRPLKPGVLMGVGKLPLNPGVLMAVGKQESKPEVLMDVGKQQFKPGVLVDVGKTAIKTRGNCRGGAPPLQLLVQWCTTSAVACSVSPLPHSLLLLW